MALAKKPIGTQCRRFRRLAVKPSADMARVEKGSLYAIDDENGTVLMLAVALKILLNGRTVAHSVGTEAEKVPDQ